RSSELRAGISPYKETHTAEEADYCKRSDYAKPGQTNLRPWNTPFARWFGVSPERWPHRRRHRKRTNHTTQARRWQRCRCRQVLSRRRRHFSPRRGFGRAERKLRHGRTGQYLVGWTESIR